MIRSPWLARASVQRPLLRAYFAAAFGRRAARVVPAAAIRMVCGVLWWALGTLSIMPTWLGTDEIVPRLDATAWQSLPAHLIYCLLPGLIYVFIQRSRRG